jgi:hypothetical protein
VGNRHTASARISENHRARDSVVECAHSCAALVIVAIGYALTHLFSTAAQVITVTRCKHAELRFERQSAYRCLLFMHQALSRMGPRTGAVLFVTIVFVEIIAFVCANHDWRLATNVFTLISFVLLFATLERFN